MNIKHFKIERYFARYEFNIPYLMCCSDCEPLSLKDLLTLADKDSLRLWEDLILGYTNSLGHPLLREEIVRLYPNHSKNEILVAIPEECIFLYMNTILNSQDHVIVTFPGYQSLYEIANSLKCDISKWIPSEEESFTFDIKDLKKLIKKNTKLLVINSPHNPTGSLLKESDIKEIINIAERNNILIFSDEMYRFLEYQKLSRLPSLSEMTPLATSLSGLSKSFSLAGLRIGWLTTKNLKILNKISSNKDYTSICNSTPSEILGIMALRAKDKILKGNQVLIRKNLKLAEDFFKNHQMLFKFIRPLAGPVAFPKLKGNIKASTFCDNLRQKKGVLLIPSTVFDYGDRHFRLGLGRKNFPKALKKLEEFIKEEYLSKSS